MKKCYISGKITGQTEFEYKTNFYYAVKEAEKLGYTAINPVKIFAGKRLGYWVLMLCCIFIELGCQAIYLQRNWKESRGARIERFVARLSFKTIIYQK